MKHNKRSVFSHLVVDKANKAVKVKKKKALTLILLFTSIFIFSFFVCNTYIWPIVNSETTSWDQCWKEYGEKEHDYNATNGLTMLEPTDPCGLPPQSSSGQIFINYTLLNILLPITLASISVTIVNKKYFK